MKMRLFRHIIFIDNKGRSRSFRVPAVASFLVTVLFSTAALCLLLFTAFWIVKISTRAMTLLAEQKSDRLHKRYLSLKSYTGRMEGRFDTLFYRDDRRRMIAGASQVRSDVREVGIGGPVEGDDAEAAITRRNDRQYQALNDRVEKLLRQSSFHLFSLDEFAGFFEEKKMVLSHIPTLIPSQGFFHSSFGMRFHPILHKRRMHKGIDIANFSGAPVMAAANGIAKVGVSETFGTYVVLDHLNGYTTIYAHLFAAAVEHNTPVQRGDILGYVGNSGLSKGPHLHYEVRKNGQPVDPLPYLLPPDYIVD
ncbi:MAG: M23 family metallopeptidase [Fibrobacterota bacterium]